MWWRTQTPKQVGVSAVERCRNKESNKQHLNHDQLPQCSSVVSVNHDAVLQCVMKRESRDARLVTTPDTNLEREVGPPHCKDGSPV
jgi:hypothetical protein